MKLAFGLWGFSLSTRTKRAYCYTHGQYVIPHNEVTPKRAVITAWNTDRQYEVELCVGKRRSIRLGFVK